MNVWPGCSSIKVKTTTTLTNKDCIRFHRSIGMKLIGKDILDGVMVSLTMRSGRAQGCFHEEYLRQRAGDRNA